MALNHRLLRPLAAGFNPRSIAGLGMWLDATDTTTLSQTSDGSTPVTTNSDPVAYWKDKITGVSLIQTIDANRPLWMADGIGGRPGLDFDGSNDVLSATSGSLMGLFRNVGGATVISVHQIKTTANALAFTFFSSTGASATAGRLAQAKDNTNGTRYNIGSRRLDNQVAVGVTGTSGLLTTNPAISTALWQLSDAKVSHRINGLADFTDSTFHDAGNTSDTNSQQISIGGVVGASVFLNAVLCEILAWPRVLSASEVANAERYLSNKYKITI